MKRRKNRGKLSSFFGEKYGLVVRVVDMGDFSKELCGGTHAKALGRIGIFKILKESSIAKGVRRIEALTGAQAEDHIQATEDLLEQASTLLETPASQMHDKIKHLLAENQELKAEAKKLRTKELHELAVSLKEKIITSQHHKFICQKVAINSDELFNFANHLTSLAPQTSVLLAIESEGRCQLLLKLAPYLLDKKIQAPDIMKILAPCIQGSGGGKGAQAQAGGTLPSGIEKAFELFARTLEDVC